MAVKLQPLADRIVVKPIEVEERRRRESTCRIQPKRSPRREKYWQLVREGYLMMGKG